SCPQSAISTPDGARHGRSGLSQIPLLGSLWDAARYSSTEGLGKRSRPCTLRASKPARERAHCIQRKFQRVGGGAMTGRYAEIYARSLRDPEGFWGELAQNITWTRKWDRVLDDSRPPFYRWFPGGELNTCFNT